MYKTDMYYSNYLYLYLTASISVHRSFIYVAWVVWSLFDHTKQVCSNKMTNHSWSPELLSMNVFIFIFMVWSFCFLSYQLEHVSMVRLVSIREVSQSIALSFGLRPHMTFRYTARYTLSHDKGEAEKLIFNQACAHVNFQLLDDLY